MKRICAVVLLLLFILLAVQAGNASAYERCDGLSPGFTVYPPDELLGCWHGKSGNVWLHLLADRTALFYDGERFSAGTFDIYPGNQIFVDIEPPGWPYRHRWTFYVEPKLLICTADDETMDYVQ